MREALGITIHHAFKDGITEITSIVFAGLGKQLTLLSCI